MLADQGAAPPAEPDSSFIPGAAYALGVDHGGGAPPGALGCCHGGAAEEEPGVGGAIERCCQGAEPAGAPYYVNIDK